MPDGTSPADGGTSGSDGASSNVTTTNNCGTATEGAACSREGESCSSGCTNPCQFCNLLQCSGGHWTRLEVPPAPCTDAAARTHPDARVSWQGPGGVTGYGPAIVVSGSGVIQVWQNQPSFPPAGAPMAPPDVTGQLTGDRTDALFDAWASTSTAALPHAGPGAECEATVYVTMCAHCMPTAIRYVDASQMAPEMNAVWSWFDANVPFAAGHPRNYCRIQ